MQNNEAASSENSQSIWQLLVSIIDKPTPTFKVVSARRKWWMWAVPLLILFLSFVVVTAVGAPYGSEIARRQAEQQLSSMPADQAEVARTQMERFTSPTAILVTGLITGAIVLPLGIVVQAAILYFGALVAGGEVSFGPVFTVSAWTRLPMALKSLVQAGFMAISSRSAQYLGLAALVTTGDPMQDARNPLVLLLSQADLFWLWHLFLVVLGLAVVARFSRMKSVVLTVVYAVLSLAVVVIPTMLFAGMAGG